MINANINESFPISVTLLDEDSSQLVPGQVVTYNVRNFDDSELSPPVNGTLVESTVEGGIYKKELSLTSAGAYVCYITCSGFYTSSEDIVISVEDVAEVAKYSLPYNISVVDVIRTETSPTASQTARNVPLGKTDYITTLVKRDTDVDWSAPVSSGNAYAHYQYITDNLPYKMGGAY